MTPTGSELLRPSVRTFTHVSDVAPTQSSGSVPVRRWGEGASPVRCGSRARSEIGEGEESESGSTVATALTAPEAVEGAPGGDPIAAPDAGTLATVAAEVLAGWGAGEVSAGSGER